MSIRNTFRGSHEEPPEYESNNPGACVHCGQDWDLDDESDFFYLIDDTSVVCREQCWTKWALKHKEEAREVAEDYGIELPEDF